MADLPVTSDTSGAAFPGSDFLKGATGMPVVRQVTLLMALAASVAVAVFVTFWMQEPEYRLLSAPENAAEMSDIVNALENRQIAFKLDQTSGAIMVGADRLYDARMALAEADVLTGGQRGYELLDQDQGFGVSQFREFNNHRRSVEGELARSVMAIKAVQHARVILATPKTSTFLRDRRRPSASVHVSLKPGRVLTHDKVRGIMNLVAAGVPELLPKHVVVVDQSGNLLSKGADDEDLLRSGRDLALTRTIENNLYDKVANILIPWVGADRFTAEVNAEVDFTREESTAERYSPDLVAVRSEQQVEEQEIGEKSSVGGVPGTLSNQPPEFGELSEAGATGSNEEEVRSTRLQSTRNYEVDRTISHTRQQVGQLQRLSVAVVVDHQTIVDADTGETASQPWTDEDLRDLTAAVQSAVGFRADRGDTVSIVNRAFYREPQIEAAPTPFYEQAWFSDVVKQTLGGIAIIVVIFGLLRPLYRNLSQAGELVREQQSLAIADMTQMREAAMQEAVPGLPSPISLDPEDSSAAKMETVRNLINEDPERVAQVVKHWVSEDE